MTTKLLQLGLAIVTGLVAAWALGLLSEPRATDFESAASAASLPSLPSLGDPGGLGPQSRSAGSQGMALPSAVDDDEAAASSVSTGATGGSALFANDNDGPPEGSTTAE